ncbi:hypothetical protein [Acidovorax sp. Root275]|uniref:hypothetical protein n=1 Tax=Acidovorax sp. Root275 TaxID=1736508 RepID=UPI0011250D90|nr:hypothetical protein [Acidovorax sp. Root275]
MIHTNSEQLPDQDAGLSEILGAQVKKPNADVLRRGPQEPVQNRLLVLTCCKADAVKGLEQVLGLFTPSLRGISRTFRCPRLRPRPASALATEVMRVRGMVRRLLEAAQSQSDERKNLHSRPENNPVSRALSAANPFWHTHTHGMPMWVCELSDSKRVERLCDI